MPLDHEAIYLRVDADTFEIVGFDIIGLRQTLISDFPQVKEVFDHLLALFGERDWRIQYQIRSPAQEIAELKVFHPSPVFIESLQTLILKIAPDLVPD